MISRLEGKVLDLSGEIATIDVHGVGYEVLCSVPLARRLAIGEQAVITIYTDVREDSIRLFGFDSSAEKQVFLLLNKVSGMGPRSSLDVVSNVEVRDLLRAIGAGDLQALTAIKGVGKKKAERIVVELRDLVGNMADERAVSLRSLVTVERNPTDGQSISHDAIAALEVLGFPRREAEAAVKRAFTADTPKNDVGSLVREALRFV